MSQDPGSQLVAVESLSVELVQMVLSALPDVSSLQAAALSCPRLHFTFLEAEAAITAQVLLNQIDISVLPEAIVAFESTCLRPQDTKPEYRQAVVDFVTRNLR